MLRRVEGGAYAARGWIRSGHLSAYVRVTRRRVNREIVETIDVASVEVPEAHQGKGCFSRWLPKVEALAAKHGRIVFVESVLNDRLASFLVARGYHTVDHVDRCYAKDPS